MRPKMRPISELFFNPQKGQNKKSDIKFYRKRILDLTRNMFKGEYPDNNLKTVFFSYVDSLIEYLITIDERDIIYIL